MKFLFPVVFLFATLINPVFSQDNFDYSIELEAINFPNLPGLHSYAFGQHGGKWLILGGRKDGLHARQPFNAFPQNQNNADIFVIDIATKQFWSKPLTDLAVGLQEQLQSTNMNFYQDEATLFIIGGYAFSPTANNHITFPNLTAVNVAGVVNAVINNTTIAPFFQQITDNNFAITGGQLGKIGNTFYLVGGHRFDGRYNPMGGPTFTQTYSNQIRKFEIDTTNGQLAYTNYSAITDAIHLHRRDYNLLPQIFADGTEGYTISSGVFQLHADLPFLYPVNITASGHTAVTGFNQYLSNYHSAKICLHDSTNNEMHSLFFGGMSQYYYQNNTLVQDDNVPFVKTISRLTRLADGTLTEYQLPIEMPTLKGASAEFILNRNLPHHPSEIIQLDELHADTVVLGHIYGGIQSSSLNPFSQNQTSNTAASPTVYAVKLIRNIPLAVQRIDGKNPYTLRVFPNPTRATCTLEFNLDKASKVYYLISNTAGEIVEEGIIENVQAGNNRAALAIDESLTPQVLWITLVIDDKFYLTEKILKQ
jgi:hypothetical protein